MLIANPEAEDWWSDIRVSDNDASPFAEEQLDKDLVALYSYKNNQQNRMGPTSMGHYDMTTVLEMTLNHSLHV